ncbi:hypothetical protein lerEdw1_020907, partial [Lerista edwardsae]
MWEELRHLQARCLLEVNYNSQEALQIPNEKQLPSATLGGGGGDKGTGFSVVHLLSPPSACGFFVSGSRLFWIFSFAGLGSFLQLAAIVVRRPMEKQNPTVPLKERPERTGEASHVPQPSSISTSPPRTEAGEEDLSAGRAPRWEDQWLDFLERVKSQGMLEEEEEEALWDEAKVAAGSSSSAVQTNPPDPRQEEDGELSLL